MGRLKEADIVSEIGQVVPLVVLPVLARHVSALENVEDYGNFKRVSSLDRCNNNISVFLVRKTNAYLVRSRWWFPAEESPHRVQE